MENLTPETRLEYYLDKIATNGGGGSAGYDVETTTNLIIHEQTLTAIPEKSNEPGSVVCEADNWAIGTPTTVTVTFNGTQYEMPVRFETDLRSPKAANTNEETDMYIGEFDGGTPDFTNYPCCIHITRQSNDVETKSAADETYPTEIAVVEAGEFTIKVEQTITSVTTTPEFEAAVNAVTGGDSGDCKVFIVNINPSTEVADKTSTEIEEAISAGKMICANLVSGSVTYSQLSTTYLHYDDDSCSFFFTVVDANGVETTIYTIDTNGDVYITTNTYPTPTPE